MKKWCVYLMMSVVVLVLGACSESKANTVDLSSYPDAVQNGQISISFFQQLQKHLKEDKFHSMLLTDIVTDIENTTDDDILQVIEEYNSYLKEVSFDSSTGIDEELIKLVSESIDSQIVTNELFLGFVENKEDDFARAIFTEATNEAIKTGKDKRAKLDIYLDRYDIEY